MDGETVYVLLNRPLPASATPHMLGRVVLDPKNPLDRYVPDDPPIKHQYRSEVTQLDVQHDWEKTGQKIEVQAGIKYLFSVGVSRSVGKYVGALKSEKMITRSLFQPRSVFNDIYGFDAPSLHRAELLQMLSKKTRGVGYFVTSFKSIVNGEFVSTKESSASWTASAGSTRTLFDPPSTSFSVAPAASSRTSASETTALKIQDEVIIAIAYRLVKVNKPLLPIRTRPIKIELGAPMKVKSGDRLPSDIRSRSQPESRNRKKAQELLRPPEPLEEIEKLDGESPARLALTGLQVIYDVPIDLVNKGLIPTNDNEPVTIPGETSDVPEIGDGDEPSWSPEAEQEVSDALKGSLIFFVEIPSSTSFYVMFRIMSKKLVSMFPSVQNVKAAMINSLVSFFTSAFYELMDELEILERPLSLGKKRIRWKCSCGQKFYSDFIEYRPGALENLQKALQSPPRRSRLATYAGENTRSGAADDGFVPASSGAPKGSAEFLQRQSANPGRSDKSSAKSHPLEVTENSHSKQDAEDPKWIYLCFRDYQDIDHENYVAVASPVPESGDDLDLFELFRDEYYKRRSNFFFTTLLWEVTRIKFVQFTYAFNGAALITKENVWPPENMCSTWIYDPVPAEEQYHPLTDGKYMLQLFRHPHQSVFFQASMKIKLPVLFFLRNVVMGFFKTLKIKIVPPNADSGLPDYEAIDGPDFTDEEPADTSCTIIEKSKWVYLSTPKKAGERLVQHPSKPPEGWGLKFEEDLVIPRLMRITFWYFFFAAWLLGVIGGAYLVFYVSITYTSVIATTIAIAGSVLALVNYFRK